MTLLIGGIPAGAFGQAAPPAAPEPTPQPTLPTDPQSPTDFPAPGRLPAPAQQPPGGGEAVQEGAAAPQGYSGGDLVVSDTNPALYGGARRGPVGPVPAFHIVKEGDTLWDLCQHYYGDPWLWPKLWAHNQAITNPHWIYPGDKIRMLSPSKAVGRARRPAPQLSVIRRADARPAVAGPIALRQSGFVDPGDLEQAARVVGSREAARLLSSHQEIYVRPSDKMPLQPGKSYGIYRVRKDLRVDGQTVGHIVEVLGAVHITRIGEGEAAAGIVTDAYNVIERGNLVGPLRRNYKRVTPRPTQADISGRIIETMRDIRIIGSDELVFINRGRKHGVQLGTQFFVVRQGDAYRQVIVVDADKTDSSFPVDAVGRITALDVYETVSIGVVTGASRALGVGDSVQTIRHR